MRGPIWRLARPIRTFPRDARWESLQDVLGGKLPVVVHADDIKQITAAVAFAEREKLKLIIAGGYDAPLCAALLKKHDIPVIVGGTYRLPRRRSDGYDTAYAVPAELHKAGIRFCISARGRFGANQVRNLPYHAAAAIGFGLPADEALKAITLYPAQILGVADRVGSLEKGKDATLFVADGEAARYADASHGRLDSRPQGRSERPPQDAVSQVRREIQAAISGAGILACQKIRAGHGRQECLPHWLGPRPFAIAKDARRWIELSQLVEAKHRQCRESACLHRLGPAGRRNFWHYRWYRRAANILERDLRAKQLLQLLGRQLSGGTRGEKLIQCHQRCELNGFRPHFGSIEYRLRGRAPSLPRHAQNG